MKRGTPRHPKVAELSALLEIPRYSAVGLLELLWHFTAEFALAGDVGRFSDDAIAQALCWDDASTKLIDALVQSGWLDRCECHRLRVHDWNDHADQTVQRVLSKRNQGFIKCYDDASTKLGPSKMPLPKANTNTNTNTAGSAPPVEAPPSGGISRFIPPSVEEVKERCSEIELSEAQGFAFIAFYESKGWMVGKNKMKCWKSALAGWKIRNSENHNGKNAYALGKAIQDQIDEHPANPRSINYAGHDVTEEQRKELRALNDKRKATQQSML